MRYPGRRPAEAMRQAEKASTGLQGGPSRKPVATEPSMPLEGLISLAAGYLDFSNEKIILQSLPRAPEPGITKIDLAKMTGMVNNWSVFEDICRAPGSGALGRD